MIPRLNDFIEMAGLLEETYSGTDLSNMTIEFTVSKGILQKINEELYFRNTAGSLVRGTPEETDEIVVKLGNVTFRCIEEEKEDLE